MECKKYFLILLTIFLIMGNVLKAKTWQRCEPANSGFVLDLKLQPGKHPYASNKPMPLPVKFDIPGVKNAAQITFTSDGNTFYLLTGGDTTETIFYSHFEDGKWTTPKQAEFSGKYRMENPCITPDGKRFFFTKLIHNGSQLNAEICVMDKTDKGWSEPKRLDEPVNSSYINTYPSCAANGNLYFSSLRDGKPKIYCSQFVNGKYSIPEPLDSVINKYAVYDSFISPDESFILFRVDKSPKSYQLFISFNENGSWLEPQNLGPKININDYQGRPYITPDGNYLFYASASSKDWISCQYQVDLKPLLKSLKSASANTNQSYAQTAIGKDWIKASDSTVFSPRAEHQVIEFKNRLWVIGGNSNDSKNIWVTDDCKHWEKAADLSFTGGQAVVFKNKIWIVNADGKSVWNSSDGKDWKKAAVVDSLPGWALRAVVYKDKIWLTGGADVFNTYLPDGKLNPNRKVLWWNYVWSSPDGVNWTKEKVTSPFPARSDHSMIVFKDKMWVIAGQSGPNKNDIWRSDDGINWELVTNAPFRARHVTQAVVFKDNIWVIGGFGFNDNGYPVILSDVWCSADGVKWDEVTPSAPFGPRMEHQSVVFKNKIWLIGGQSGEFPKHYAKNDIWYTGLDQLKIKK